MRSKHRIGALVLISLLTLYSFERAGADPASKPDGSTPGPVTNTQTQPSNDSQTEKAGERDSRETPADSFTPSESISADSAVSFPVDI
jgi:hypothetical protein